MILRATGEAVRILKDSVPEVITIHAVGCPSGSRLGDSDEAAFMARACEFDFRVAKPWGNIDPYDVLVGIGRGFWRVQVKRATHDGHGQYHSRSGGRRGRYTKDTIDFIAAHLARENIWYIVPVEAFASDIALQPARSPKVQVREVPRRVVPARLRSQSPRLERHSRSLPV